MSKNPFILSIAAVAGVVLLTGTGRAPAHGHPAAAVRPILVELFTSEGCSSCPPADEYLRHLEDTQPIPGVQIIGLEEHVDYWDHNGWKDPFSSAAYTQRQNDYASRFHLDSVYTPQMVVNGRSQFVGSDTDAADQSFRHALLSPSADVMVRWLSGNRISVTAANVPHVDNVPIDVWLAVTQRGLSTHVLRGENAKTTLHHSAIVHSLVSLGAIGAGVSRFTSVHSLDVRGDSPENDLSAVVFLQQGSQGGIVGAGEAQAAQ